MNGNIAAPAVPMTPSMPSDDATKADNVRRALTSSPARRAPAVHQPSALNQEQPQAGPRPPPHPLHDHVGAVCIGAQGGGGGLPAGAGCRDPLLAATW
jgi:hypothetical protein